MNIHNTLIYKINKDLINVIRSYFYPVKENIVLNKKYCLKQLIEKTENIKGYVDQKFRYYKLTTIKHNTNFNYFNYWYVDGEYTEFSR